MVGTEKPNVFPLIEGINSKAPSTVMLESKTPSVENSEDEMIVYPSGLVLNIIVVALGLSMFLVALDMTIITTAIPRITDEFKSIDQIGWYGSAFFLTLAAFQSTWGKLYKYFSPKTTFLSSIFIFEVGSLICGVCQSSITLIIGRAIAGCGAAGVVSGCYIIITFIAPPSSRPAYTSIIGAVFGLASVAGPLLGGFFTDRLSWRWCFYINLPIGGVSLAIILFFFKKPNHFEVVKATLYEVSINLDLMGTLLIIGALACILLDLEWGGVTNGWGSSPVIGTLVGFGILTAVFIANELWMQERALLIPRILKKRTVFTCCIYVLLQSGGNFLFIYYLPVYFQAIKGLSAAESGIRNLPFIAVSSFMAIFSGILIMKIGYFTPLLFLGSGVFTIGGTLTYTLKINSSLGEYLAYQAVLGLGQGLCIQLPVIVCQALSIPEDIPATTAMVLFFQMLGGAVFVSVGESIFSNTLIKSIESGASGLNSALVIQTGSSELRQVFGPDELVSILEAYMSGLKNAFALGIALAATATLMSLGPPMKSIKGKIELGDTFGAA